MDSLNEAEARENTSCELQNLIEQRTKEVSVSSDDDFAGDTVGVCELRNKAPNMSKMSYLKLLKVCGSIG
jgi:hypothetical protein